MSTPSLRPLVPDDAEAVLDAFQADPGMRRQGDVQDIQAAQKYIAFLTSVEQGNHAFAIEVDGICAGVVAINGNNQHRLGWFFYWVHRNHRGRGLASWAAATVANWALGHGGDDDARLSRAETRACSELSEAIAGGRQRDAGFQRLELGHRANNPESGSVARAAGFVHEGTERQKFIYEGSRVDALTYGRLRADPVPQIPQLAISA